MSTNTLNQQGKITLANITLAVLEAIQESAPVGAPGGIIYAALMQQGATLNQYNSLMGCLVRSGHITQEMDVFQITPKGEATVTSLRAVFN